MTKRAHVLTLLTISLLLITLLSIPYVHSEDTTKTQTPDKTDTKEKAILDSILSFVSKIKSSEQSKWEEIYQKQIDKNIADATTKITDLKTEIIDLKTEIDNIRNNPKNQDKTVAWLNSQINNLELSIKKKQQEIAGQESAVKKWQNTKVILGSFFLGWLLIKYILIPALLVFLIRNYLLILIANLIDSSLKTSFMKSFIKTITFGENTLGFFVWFVLLEIIYISFLRGSWIEVKMGMLLLWMTMNILYLFSMDITKPTRIFIAMAIGAAIIFIVIGGLYALLRGSTTKLKKEKRDMKSKQLGADIKALKETAEAAIEPGE